MHVYTGCRTNLPVGTVLQSRMSRQSDEKRSSECIVKRGNLFLMVMRLRVGCMLEVGVEVAIKVLMLVRVLVVLV